MALENVLQLLVRPLLYAAVAVGAAVLAWGLLRGPVTVLKGRLASEGQAGWRAPNELPWWAAAAGGLLVVVFVGLSAQQYFGISLPTRLFGPGPSEPEAIADPAGVRAWYLPDALGPLTPGVRVVVGPGDAALVLTVDDVVLTGSTGDLVRLRAQGPAARLTGHDGQRVRVGNVGAWDQASGSLAGLDAVYQGGRWILDASPPRPANPNSDFREGSEDDPIPGYGLVAVGSPGDTGFRPGNANFKLTRLMDEGGAFVRVLATRSVAYLSVRGKEPLSTLDGPPVAIRGQIRAHSASGELSLALHDVVNENGRAVDQLSRAPASEAWTALWVRTPRATYPSSDDYFTLGLARVSEGDWFDVRELSVFVGVFPLLGDAPTSAE